jgi:hypothetical protein
MLMPRSMPSPPDFRVSRIVDWGGVASKGSVATPTQQVQ